MGVPGGMFANCRHAQQKTTQFVRRDHVHAAQAELQKRANCANKLVLFFLAGANFLGKAHEKQAKTRENRQKQAKPRENRQKTGAFLVLIFLGEKLVGANFYAFCNYV